MTASQYDFSYWLAVRKVKYHGNCFKNVVISKWWERSQDACCPIQYPCLTKVDSLNFFLFKSNQTNTLTKQHQNNKMYKSAVKKFHNFQRKTLKDIEPPRRFTLDRQWEAKLWECHSKSSASLLLTNIAQAIFIRSSWDDISM